MPRVSLLRVDIHGRYTEVPGTQRERDVLLALERGASVVRRGGPGPARKGSGRPPARVHVSEGGVSWRCAGYTVDMLVSKGLVQAETRWSRRVKDWDIVYSLAPHVTRVYATSYAHRHSIARKSLVR